MHTIMVSLVVLSVGVGPVSATRVASLQAGAEPLAATVLPAAALSGSGGESDPYQELSRLPRGSRIRIEQGERSRGFQRDGPKATAIDFSRHEGLLAAYAAGSVTISQQGRDLKFPLGEGTRVYTHRGQAWKGALIGAAIGLAIATPMIISSVNATEEENYGAVTGPMVFVLTTSLGAILGGIDHWVKVYPD